MEKIKRLDSEAWAGDNNWLKVVEGGNATGQQNTYLSPSGDIVIVQYDLHGDLFSVGKVVPAPAQKPPPFMNLGGPSGSQFPAR